MEKMKFDPTTRTATCYGFNYSLGSAAVAAEMKLVALDKNQIGKVTYNPNVLDLITACVMAKCLYGIYGVDAPPEDELGTLILHPECDEEYSTKPDIAGDTFGRYVPDKQSPAWTPENQVPYVPPYASMALRAIESLKDIEVSPFGHPQFKIKSKMVHWGTEFNPDCMLGIEVRFLVHLTMESGQKFLLIIRDRTIFIYPKTENAYFHNTTLDVHGTTPLDEDILALQILGVLNMYAGLTYEKVQEFLDLKMDWIKIEDSLPKESQNVKFMQAPYNNATGLYEYTAGNGFYKDNRFWDVSTGQPVEVTKWKPRKL